MRLAIQSPRLGITSANHTARAIMSQEPVKRVFAVLEITASLALFCSVSDRVMHLYLTSEEKKNSTTQREVSVILSHIISYLRLVIVTESVTNCQTSETSC